MRMNNRLNERKVKFNRTRNVERNVVFGLLNRFFALLLPFIVRTVLIYRFGAVYLGMNSLFASVLEVLNLAELGFGSAVVYSLYLPLAREDTDTVCAYLGTYRKIYRIIGIVIFVAGLAVMPFLPWLLQGSTVPDGMNVFIWYLIFLVNAATSYLLYGYKTSVPSALQRNDVLSKIDTVVLIGRTVVQLFFLYCTDNFYYYLLTSLCFTLVRNVLIARVTEKLYPQYVCRGSISRAQFTELKKLVYGLLLSKIRGTSRHAIDSICITAFIGLTMTAIYANYFLIHSSVVSISFILADAMMASVGNSIATESTEKTWQDMRRFNFLYMLAAGWATICLLCLYQPFVRLWVGPDLMLGMPEVAALCLYFYVLKAGDIRWIYFEGAGLWWKARYFVIAEILANIVLNILLAKYWGVLGIILASLFSLFFIDFINGARILFDEYFKNGKLGMFFADHGKYLLVTVVLAGLCFYACEQVSVVVAAWFTESKMGQLVAFALRLIICTVVSVLGYWLAYHRTEQYKEAKQWVRLRIDGWRKK